MSNTNYDSDYIELVTVIKTNDKALIAFIKSIFQEADIKYFVKGESLVDLGRAALDVEIQVANKDLEDAKEILKEFL